MIARDGQIRLWWEGTPTDLFFDYAPIHDEAARNRRTVPFEGIRIPVLGPVELAVFKVMFDRTRDWADLEAMAERGTLDLEAVRARLEEMLDEGDARFARLGALRGLAPGDYELQMLLGVRSARGDELVRDGHRLRVYVPFGTHWYEYSVRRLQENPRIAGYVAADTMRRLARR